MKVRGARDALAFLVMSWIPQPTQASCCLLFGCLLGFRQGTGRDFWKTPTQRSSPGPGQSGGSWLQQRTAQVVVEGLR